MPASPLPGEALGSKFRRRRLVQAVRAYPVFHRRFNTHHSPVAYAFEHRFEALPHLEDRFFAAFLWIIRYPDAVAFCVMHCFYAEISWICTPWWTRRSLSLSRRVARDDTKAIRAAAKRLEMA